jgi:transcriptional regulator with XRE-family HTH domain
VLSSLKELGLRIQRARKRLGLSQEEFAFKAELDRSYVGGIERGERNVTFGTLCRLAKALNTDVGTLTKGLPR